MGHEKNESSYFWLVRSKHLPVLKDRAKVDKLFSLCWLVEGERGKGRENAFTPPPQQKGS
jgi:hypothetical protein